MSEHILLEVGNKLFSQQFFFPVSYFSYSYKDMGEPSTSLHGKLKQLLSFSSLLPLLCIFCTGLLVYNVRHRNQLESLWIVIITIAWYWGNYWYGPLLLNHQYITFFYWLLYTFHLYNMTKPTVSNSHHHHKNDKCLFSSSWCTRSLSTIITNSWLSPI